MFFTGVESKGLSKTALKISSAVIMPKISSFSSTSIPSMNGVFDESVLITSNRGVCGGIVGTFSAISSTYFEGSIVPLSFQKCPRFIIFLKKIFGVISPVTFSFLSIIIAFFSLVFRSMFIRCDKGISLSTTGTFWFIISVACKRKEVSFPIFFTNLFSNLV